MGNPKRSKGWGYEVEVAAVRALKKIFPGLKRTGSVAYSDAAPDLVQEGRPDMPALHLVVTRDKRQPLLVTMSTDDLQKLVENHGDAFPVYVQVKGRARTWVGGLMRDLRKASKGWDK